jgi:predicted phage terminase large subunit-like protein
MKPPNREIFEALLRNDLLAFTQRCFQTVVPGQQFLTNWHLEAIAHELERVRRGETRRLIITIPPRSLKSICASVSFPAYVLGHDPSVRIVCASYSQELTSKHARDCRHVMESEWYKQLFPRTRIDARKNTESEFETTARGYRLGTSVGGTLTGRGGNLILIDDPMKPAEAMSETKRANVAEWYDSTLSSRLDRKTEDAIVIIMQRLHIDDLVGHVLDKGIPWTQLDLPAIADERHEVDLGSGKTHQRKVGEVLHPEREPRSALDELKATMGSRLFSAQYQQAPVPLEGDLIKRAWFRSYSCRPAHQMGDQIVQSWDTASKANKTNDYSVCTTWLKRKDDYYLLHVLRDRLEYPDLRRKVLSHAREHDAKAVLIEDASSGAQLLQDLLREGPIRPIAIKPEGDKVVRLEGQSARIEAGHVLLPESAPWLGDFLDEILAFPGGRFDDQVDSFSQFLVWADKPMSRYHFGRI